MRILRLDRLNAYEWWAKRIHPDDRDEVFSIFNKALAAGDESLTMEYRFQCADGTWSNVYDSSQIFRDESGQAYRVIGALRNVTNLRRTEEELRQSEARFRMLADSMPQLVWTADPDGHVDYFNERYKEYQSHVSAGIGDARSSWDTGVITHVTFGFSALQ